MATQDLPISTSLPPTRVRARGAMVSPLVDFLIVGGLSLLVIPFLAWIPWDPASVAKAGVVSSLLTFAINDPHFTFSYLILYDRYWYKLTKAPFSQINRLRYLIAGIVAPVALAAWMAWAVLGSHPEALGRMVNAMFSLVGWHYVKQSYGILVVLSGRKNVPFDALEAAVLKANAYAVWITSWIGMQYGATGNLYGVTFTTFKSPMHIYLAAAAVCGVCFLALLGLIARRYWRGKPMPPANAWVGYVAGLYAWLFILYTSPVVLLFVPMWHALQYLLFVWKYQKGKARNRAATATEYRIYSAVFIGSGIALGAALFLWVPRYLDLHLFYDVELFGPTLFMALFALFINIHHYFIDNAIWRKDNPEMRYLFE
jgi:hypothetical protein